MLPFEPLVCTIGPDFKNNPVSEIASSSEPPPLRRRSTTKPGDVFLLQTLEQREHVFGRALLRADPCPHKMKAT